jgi:hypothetical protein
MFLGQKFTKINLRKKIQTLGIHSGDRTLQYGFTERTLFLKDYKTRKKSRYSREIPTVLDYLKHSPPEKKFRSEVITKEYCY